MSREIKFVRKGNEYVISEGRFNYTMPLFFKYVLEKYNIEWKKGCTETPIEDWYQSLDRVRKSLIKKDNKDS